MPLTVNTPCSELHKLHVHEDRAAAETWLKQCLSKKGLDSYDSCSILVFYKVGNNLVRALKPNGKHSDQHNHLRIIGAENQLKKSISETIFELCHFKKRRVPRCSNLVGDEIIPSAPYGILIVYEKTPGQGVGKYIHPLLEKLKKDLSEKAALSETNSLDSKTISFKELTEGFFQLAAGHFQGKNTGDSLRSGRIYYISPEGEGSDVYRYTFKKHSNNPVESALLAEEANNQLTTSAEIRAPKRINHHYAALFRGCLKVFSLGILIGATCGGLAFLFLIPIPIPCVGPIVSACVAVVLAAIIIIKGISTEISKHKPIVEYGETSFLSSPSDSSTSPRNSCERTMPSCGSSLCKLMPDTAFSAAKTWTDVKNPFTTVETSAIRETGPDKGISTPRHVRFMLAPDAKVPEDLELSIPETPCLSRTNLLLR